MRILSKRQLKEMVLYSPQHVARLEKAGTFPQRIQLGPNRVGWVEDEVLDWLQRRLDSRKYLTDTPEKEQGWPGVHYPVTHLTKRLCCRFSNGIRIVV